MNSSRREVPRYKSASVASPAAVPLPRRQTGTPALSRSREAVANRSAKITATSIAANQNALESSPWLERLLVLVTIMISPLEEQIPTVGGFSIMFVVFLLLLGYTILFRIGSLMRMMRHPVFLSAYLFLVCGYVMETIHSNSSDSQLMRIAQMFLGGVLIAALCQRKATLRAALYGYVIAGTWLSTLLLLTSYGALRGARTGSFSAASMLRARVFEDSPLHNNLNTLAFVAAQGATVALAWALTATDLRRRNIFFFITFLCSLGAFLPLSRSGILMLIVCLLVVMLMYRGNRSRALSMMIVLGVGLILVSPDAAFSRLSYSTQRSANGKMEGRARIYSAAIDHFPEYVVEGVGAGNFWGGWGKSNGFGDWGAHNSLIQVTIYWGTPALLALLLVLWRSFRCLPRTHRDDAIVLALYGISMSLLMRMLTSHNLYAKEFALGFGLLATLRQSLPSQVALPVVDLRNQNRRRAADSRQESAPHIAPVPRREGVSGAAPPRISPR